MDLFELNGRVVVDLADAVKAFDTISKEGQQTQSKLSKFFSGIGKGAAVVGKAVGTGLMAGGAAMGALTVKAMNLGGELEQNMGGSEAVFKEHATKMQETAKGAFSNMGLSTSDYLATANKMGALFQGAGFSIKDSMDLSSGAMQRAADVASIMGIDTSAAMEAIAGAAKGNFTMMDNLGVAMNDTTLNAYAAAKGINKTTQEMTNQEKIGLAMEMFMEKTAYAAGNYAKENETLAGSLGTAKAALTNFLDGSGDVESLVTSFGNLANVIVRQIGELAPRLVSGITDIINQIVPMLPPLIQKLLPVIINGAVSLINGLVQALPSIIQALMGALPSLIEGVTKIVNALVEALPQIIEALVSALPSLIPMLIDALVNMIVTLCNSFSSIIQPIIDYLPDIIIAIVEALVNNLPALIDGIITLIMGIVEAIPQIIQGIVDALPTIIELLITSLLSNLPKIIAGLIQVVWGIVKSLPQIFASLNEGVVNIFKGIWEAIKNVFGMLKDWFSEKFGGAVDAIKEVFGKIGEWFSGVWDGIKNVFSNIGGWFKEKFQGAKENVTNAWSDTKDKFSSIKEKIASAFSNIKEKLSKPFTDARDKIKEIADKIKGFFKGEISMPKIKMPHFGITPKGWKIGDLLKGEIPKLKIDWYAEAMRNPMIMNKPTIFGYDAGTGKLLGGGEAGSEVVSGTSTLMRMIQAAVSSENSAIAYYLQKIIEILAEYFPNFLEEMGKVPVWDSGVAAAQLAPAMNVQLGIIKSREERGR